MPNKLAILGGGAAAVVAIGAVIGQVYTPIERGVERYQQIAENEAELEVQGVKDASHDTSLEAILGVFEAQEQAEQQRTDRREAICASDLTLCDEGTIHDPDWCAKRRSRCALAP